jgi:hypothetical protein
MNLPFAVYTAREGYNWATNLGPNRPLFDRIRTAIGKSPDVEMGDKLYCGVVNCGDTVAVYRFLQAKNWDSKGRDASYLAIACLPRAEAVVINFKKLLEDPCFTEPSHTPPSTISYSGEPSAPLVKDVTVEGVPGGSPAWIDLSCAGELFSSPFEGKLHLMQVEGDALSRLSYYPPVQPSPENKCTSGTLSHAEEIQTVDQALNPVPARSQQFKHERVLISLAVVLFIIGSIFNASEFLTGFKRIEEQDGPIVQETDKRVYHPWIDVHICWRTIGFSDLFDDQECLYCSKGDLR